MKRPPIPSHVERDETHPASNKRESISLDSKAQTTGTAGVSSSLQRGDPRTLTPHRLPEFALSTDSLLNNEIVMGKYYRRIAAALSQFTIRHGTDAAVQFNSRLSYALLDPENTERHRFEEIARCWFPDLDPRNHTPTI